MSTTTKAGQRILSVLDENSFVEIGSLVTARATDFNMEPSMTPSDGCVTGYGTIDNRLVYVYSQDVTVLGGTIGEMHARKIVNIYDLALKMGAPVIGLIDCAGLRLQEASDALNAFGCIYEKQVAASGVIPQVTAILGNCGGGLALFPGLTDFTFMEEKSAKLFVNSPNALDGNYVDKNNTASAAFQSAEAGLVDGIGSEADIISQIRDLIGFLPSNNMDVAHIDCLDDLNRQVAGAEGFLQDTASLATVIADGNDFFEIRAAYAPEMVTGFIRLNGATVGVVANKTAEYDENGKASKKFDAVLTPAGCDKAADFVKFCDAFEIPVVTLTNTRGFEATVCAEKKIARAAAALTAAFASATVPKINVVIGEAYGNAANVMNSKAIGADLVIAWPNAKLGTMDGKLAAKILYANESADVQKEKAAEYDALTNQAAGAARRGYVDMIVAPEDTRRYLIASLEMLYSKSVCDADRKHTTI